MINYQIILLLVISIYLETRTFIFGSNFDYRLIFLIFTIPYVTNLKNGLIK